MLRLGTYRSLYVAFDRFPSSKGAGTHIAHASATLAKAAPPCLLMALGDAGLDAFETGGEMGPDILRFREPIPNFLRRAAAFSHEVADVLDELAGGLRICHFRDPWGGVPICSRGERKFGIVYEVNGLPSVELPYRYPKVGAAVLERIARMEDFCLAESDLLIVPSPTIAANLRKRGVPAGKIRVVPNGATAAPARPRPEAAPGRYVLYFGAVQPWQGVPVLLRAFSRIADLADVRLVLCASVKRRATVPLRRLSRRLGLEERVRWEHRLSREELQGWLQHAAVSVAPLTECSRNLSQGCCPLKILEAMAAGVPVIASDLPVTRELIDEGANGRLVPAGRPEALALALRHLLERPGEAARLGAAGHDHITKHFTWRHSHDRQAEVYAEIPRVSQTNQDFLA